LANIMTFKAEPKGTERKANMTEDGYSVKSGDNVLTKGDKSCT